MPDQKRKLYFFELALTPNVFWVDLRKLDLSAETGKVLKSTSAPIKPTSIPARANDQFKEAAPFKFLGI